MKSDNNLDGYAEKGGFAGAYADLKAAGLHWKKAFFAAWFSAPKDNREPKLLAAKRDEKGQIITEGLDSLLGYSSPQVFHKWKHQDWFRELGIERLREMILLEHLGDVDRKTITAAKTEDGSAGVQARKLFYELLKLIEPEHKVEVMVDLQFKKALEKAYGGSNASADETEDDPESAE